MEHECDLIETVFTETSTESTVKRAKNSQQTAKQRARKAEKTLHEIQRRFWRDMKHARLS